MLSFQPMPVELLVVSNASPFRVMLSVPPHKLGETWMTAVKNMFVKNTEDSNVTPQGRRRKIEV